jgi:hypothetical protein
LIADIGIHETKIQTQKQNQVLRVTRDGHVIIAKRRADHTESRALRIQYLESWAHQLVAVTQIRKNMSSRRHNGGGYLCEWMIEWSI